MEEKMLGSNHRLSLQQRKSMNITGVLDVISFDEKEILLETSDGMLSIKGNELHINNLSVERGELDVVGMVDALLYSQVMKPKAVGSRIVQRLFQ